MELKYLTTCRFPEIELGAQVCDKIKSIYFGEDLWTKAISDKVAVKFSALKQIARLLYPGLSEEDMLRQLAKYTSKEIIDAFEDFCEEGQKSDQGSAK